MCAVSEADVVTKSRTTTSMLLSFNITEATFDDTAKDLWQRDAN